MLHLISQTHQRTSIPPLPKTESCTFFLNVIYWETDRQTDIDLFVPLIHELTGWFLHAPWPRIKPSTLAHQDDAPTSGATWPGQNHVRFYSNILKANEWNVNSLPHRGITAIQRISWLTVKRDEAVFLGINVTLNIKDSQKNNDVENVYSTNTVLKY